MQGQIQIVVTWENSLEIFRCGDFIRDGSLITTFRTKYVFEKENVLAIINITDARFIEFNYGS